MYEYVYVFSQCLLSLVFDPTGCRPQKLHLEESLKMKRENTCQLWHHHT